MRSYWKIKLAFSVALCICLLTVLSVQAQMADDEWVDIPVVVNIIGASNSSNVDEAVRKANEILAGAHIRLIVIKTIDGVHIGDGDESLIGNERTTAVDYAQQELANICGAGKGIKITVADDVWGEDPNVRGWCLHGIPLIFVEPDEPNTMGNVMAHVIGHSLGIKEHSPDPNNIMYESIPRGTNWDPNDVNEIFRTAEVSSCRIDLTWGASCDFESGVGYYIIYRDGRKLGISESASWLDDFYDQDINDPCGVIPGPNDPCIVYTDLREIVMFCGNPFDPCGETILEIELGGNRPNDFDVNSFFDVFVSELNDAPVGVFHVNVPASDPPTAIWNDLRSGETFTIAVWITSDRAATDRGIFTWGNPLARNGICLGFRHQWGQSLESFKVWVESTTEDYRVPDQPPIIIEDDTEPFEYGLAKPWVGPSIGFVPWGVAGWGFGSDKEVGIELDGEVIGTTTAKADGSFIWLMDPELELEVGLHAVIVKELDDSEPTGAAYATGYFKYCPEGPVVGDFDNDCDVDFRDFAFFANDWLKGTTPL